MVLKWGGVNGTQQLRNTLIISQVINSLSIIGKINTPPVTGYYKGSESQRATLLAVLSVNAAWEGRDVLKNAGVR
jgi:hypothetical protein